MFNNDSNVILNSRWCFNRNELVITFPESQTAREYQRMNPEGRIFGNSREYSDKDVYLPHPQGLSSLRGSSQGEHFSLVLEFASEREARAWDEKVFISTIYGERSKVHVYINKKLTMGGGPGSGKTTPNNNAIPTTSSGSNQWLRPHPKERNKPYHPIKDPRFDNRSYYEAAD